MKFKFCGTQGSHSPLPITPYTLQYLHYPLFPLVPHPSAFTPHSLCLQNVITFLFWLIGALLSIVSFVNQFFTHEVRSTKTSKIT